MILQCDQCSTKFRLDESKLKPGGVKVRCSKCRHIFLAGAEQKIEESEFDSILSGLGAPVSEKREESAPARQEESFPGLAEEPAAAEAHSGKFDFLEGAGSAPGETFDFGEFSLASEPVAALEEPTPAASTGLDFDDFDFNAEPVMQPQDAASAANGELDFDEFSFTDEPAVNTQEPPTADKEVLDFGEFSFAEEPGPNKVEPALAASESADFGGFYFTEEPAVNPVKPAPAATDALDFGEFSFAGEPALAEKEALDFGEFGFTEEPPFGTVDALDDAFSFSEEPLQNRVDEGAPVTADFLALSEFSFPDFAPERAVANEQPAEKPEPAQKGVGSAASAVQEAAEYEQQPAASIYKAMDAKKGTQAATLDMSYGAKPPAFPVPEVADEELSPLAISSRRKGRSLLTVSIVVISVIAIVTLTCAGLYLLQSGPAALYRFDSLGLGFVAKWFGMESPEEGHITIRNPLAAFHQNKEAGEIFVVTGEVVNSYRKARASLHVKVSLFDKKGAVLLQKTAYCGNKLSNEQLETLPMAKMESIMNNQFGDSLVNLGVQPGHAIGFVVAIDNVPKETSDFGVEVAGSTVAGQ